MKKADRVQPCIQSCLKVSWAGKLLYRIKVRAWTRISVESTVRWRLMRAMRCSWKKHYLRREEMCWERRRWRSMMTPKWRMVSDGWIRTFGSRLSFLRSGVITADLSWPGETPEDNDRLIIEEIGQAITLATLLVDESESDQRDSMSQETGWWVPSLHPVKLERKMPSSYRQSGS